MAKWVYRFSEGNASMRPLLGGKGANLAEMTGLGMPIPQGFTVTTEACTEYYRHGKQITDEIQAQIFEAIGWLEEYNGKKFGDTQDPLLVSVRSGARASMPGMMDTILNLGLNDVAVEGFAVKTGNPRFAYDSYRRFIQMFSDVVMEVPKSYFEKIIDEVKADKGVVYDTELTADDLKELKEILTLIEDVNQKYGNTVIMVTHNDAIKNMADRVIRLRDGQIRKNYVNETKIAAGDLDW